MRKNPYFSWSHGTQRCSLRASSPFWDIVKSRRARGTREETLARSRAACFARPNMRACRYQRCFSRSVCLEEKVANFAMIVFEEGVESLHNRLLILGTISLTSKRFIGRVFYLSLTNFGIKYFSRRWIDNEKDPGKGKVDCSYMKQQSWYLSLQLVQLITCYCFVRWLVHQNKHLMIKNKEK